MTGDGMEPDVLARARDPFFTTKEVGKGSGLGLSMVHGFAAQSGGTLTLYSEPGRGTTARLYLPRATTVSGQIGAVPEDIPLAEGFGRILVVEDDPDVRRISTRILKNQGYQVFEAGDGPEAISLLLSAGPFDLLFTDLVLPGGLKGTDIAEAAEKQQPGIAVLYTTGYTENVVVHGGRLDPGVRLIRKPHNRRALLAAVQECIAAGK
jgi:CheY-like chemotaxis protein